MKILVPVDFSGHTDITCKYALEFARVYGAEIMLFHTYFDQITVADTSFPDTLDMSTMYNEELMNEIFRQAERTMVELEQKVQEMIRKEGLENINLLSKVTGGEIEHELKEICAEFHPDLVVMGTTGKGNNLNVWGRVTTFIIDHARVPVITVPNIKQFQGFSNIMLAADLSDGNAESLAGLLDLFSPFRVKIHVVHFITRPKDTDAYVRMKALQVKFGKEEKTNLVSFAVEETGGDNQKAIDQFISAHDISMIAFFPHKRSLVYMMFTKNITKKNLFAANVPLVAVPVKPR